MFTRTLGVVVLWGVVLGFIFSLSVFAQEGNVLTNAEQNVISQPAAVEATLASAELSANQEMTVTPEAVPASEGKTGVLEEKKPAAATTEVSFKESEEKATEWLWGEVVGVDPEKKEMIIKHLDYETYEEVHTTIVLDDKTMFENAKDLTQIKTGDHLSVDYQIKEGANIAELVVVEQEEIGAGSEPAQEEIKPSAPVVKSAASAVEAPLSNQEVVVPEVVVPEVVNQITTQTAAESSAAEIKATTPAVEAVALPPGNEVAAQKSK